ncbi:MAG: DUF4350 domain-containing protein [Bacteroidota bacterium]
MSGFRRYIIGISVLLVFYLVAQYFKPKPTDWAPTFIQEDKIPFGTYLLKEQVTEIFPNAKLIVAQTEIYSTLKNQHKMPFNYLILAKKIKVGSLDYKQMVKSMQAGNQIFIAASEIEGVLLRQLKLKIVSDLQIIENNKRDAINFVNPLLKGDYHFEKNISEHYFSRLDSSRAIVLGEKQHRQANFVKYQFGKGALYILPNPKLLTNYSLLKKDGADYASKALSHLPKTEYLILDEYFTKPPYQNQSILRVLFEYDQLRWAYCISIFSLIAFVLFEVKRRQRIIPIQDRLKNTTVEFAEVVGSVYYQQRNNNDIAAKKVTYVLEYIRTKYRLKTTELTLEFKNALINISGAEADLIDELLQEITYLKAGNNVSDPQLIRINKLIEQFYKQDQ